MPPHVVEAAARAAERPAYAPTLGAPALREAIAGPHAAAVGRGATLAIVNTPVNPTGYVFRSSDLDAIAAALAGSSALLVSDEAAEMRTRAVAAANETGVLHAAAPEGAAFVWAELDGDEDAWSDRLAREHGVTALPGRPFHARTPHLRIPFGGRREAREALLAELPRI
jgi:aspartate/methionine/tyrosine aminotransferase